MTIQIICDSNCNIPPHYQERLGIIEVPSWINFADGSTLRNRVDISDAEFYRRLTSEKHLPTTSQPTPQDFIDAVTASSADEIILATVSSRLSGTHNSAVQAVEKLPNRAVSIHDSLSLSMGAAWQIIVGAELAAADADVPTVLAAMHAAQERISTVFVTDTLKYLAASGRAPMVQAMLGNLLDIKPMLVVLEGKFELVGRVRGRKRSKLEMLARTKAAVGSKPVRLAVPHGNVPDEAAEFAESVRKEFDVRELVVIEVGPVLGALAGPGVLALVTLTVD